jgi:hypothetical protein
MHDFEAVLGYHLEEPRKRNQRPPTDAPQNNTKTTAPPSGAAGQKKRQATPSNKSLKQESAKHKAQKKATAGAASSPALPPPSTAAAAPPTTTATPAAIKPTAPPLPPSLSSIAATAAVVFNQTTPATATNASVAVTPYPAPPPPPSAAAAALPAALFDGSFSVTPATARGMGQGVDKKKAPRTATGNASKRALPTTIFAKHSRKIRKNTHGRGALVNKCSSRKGALANNSLPPLPTSTKIRLIIPSANKQNNNNYSNSAEKPTPIASAAKQHVHWASPPSAPTGFPPQQQHQGHGQDTPAAALAGIVSPHITTTAAAAAAADTAVYTGIVVSKSTEKKSNINTVCPPLFKPAPPPNYTTATYLTALPPIWEEQNRQGLPLAAGEAGSGFNNNNGIRSIGICAISHKYGNANGSSRGKVPLIFGYKPMMTERKQMQQAATMSALFSREKQLLRLWDESQKKNTTTTTTSGYKNKGGGGGVKDKKKSRSAGHHQQKQGRELSPALLRVCELLRASKV